MPSDTSAFISLDCEVILMPDVKGNPYRFTLLFNQTDPRHRRAVEILNQQGKSKSQYIVTAILHYIDCSKLPVDSTSEYQSLQSLADRIIEQTAKRVLDGLEKAAVRSSPALAIPVQLKSQEPELSEKISEAERNLLASGLGSLRSRNAR